MHKALVKHVLYPLHEKVIGRKTLAFLKELESLQWKSPSELEELKFIKLQNLLRHARKNIPFYAKRFSDSGFDPDRMTSIQDLAILPMLTKADIRKNLETLKWNDSPGGLFRYNTGGSTGEPLIFYFDRRRQAYDAAARALTHRWWDIDIGDKELYLWGSPLEIKKQDRLKTLRDALTNQRLISAFEISPQQIPDIFAQINKFHPQCIFGYPSTIELFCKMAAARNLYLKDMRIKAVFSTAEVLYDHQQQCISEYFGGVPVVDGYGSREGGFISHQCRERTHHVIDPNYVLEIIKDGKPAKCGEDGEIVVTHLDAWGMPFIRYRTGDIAQVGSGQCPCGRGFGAISTVQGRTTDFIVTPDGRWQHALSIIYVVRDIEGVAEFKIIQHDVDDIQVLLKIHEGLYPVDGHERITSGFRKRMGQNVRVRIEVVTDIPKEASGKHRYVISKVSRQGIH